MEGSISTSVSTVRSMHQHFPNSGEPSTSHLPRERDQLQRPLGSAGDIQDRSSGNNEGLSETLKDPEYAQNAVGGLNTINASNGAGASIPASPRMSMHALVLPSPPDSPGPSRSPSIDSVSESSLPSVSSSFFFSSSAPGSPGRSHPSSYPSSHPHSDHEHEHEHGEGEGGYPRHGEETFVIPSLAMPDALRRPTPFGQTLGNLRVLVLGGQGAGKSFLTGLLLEDNEDVVDVGTWEDWNGGTDAYGKVLTASTDWAEQRDVFGLERYEPTRNVEIVELPGYSHDADVQELITRLKAVIEAPFRALHDVLHPDSQPSVTVANMLAAPTSPLYTALIFLLPSPPTPLDKEIIHALSTDIPLIVLPRLSGPHRGLGSASPARLSSFRPVSAVALRSGLFHSPETVALLRREAVDRFMRWREVERAVEEIWEGSQRGTASTSAGHWIESNTKIGRDFSGRSSHHDLDNNEHWSKTKWEAEWMGNYSCDVAVRMRQGTITERKSRRRRSGAASSLSKFDADGRASEHGSHSHSHSHDRTDGADGQPPHTHAPFDPLHLPSLLMFSMSLLGPLRSRLGETVWGFVELFGDIRVQMVVAGGFCVGVGFGTWGRVW